MPGATTGRPRGRPRKAAAPSEAANIGTFTRVSKHAAAIAKDVSEKKVVQTVEISQGTPATPSTRKRKAARSPEPEEVATPPTQRRILNITTKSTKKARLQAPEAVPRTSTQEQIPSTPRRNNKKRALSPEFESPRTKEAGNLFKRLRIQASPSVTVPRLSSPLITQASTPATSVIPDSEEEENDDGSAATTPEPELALPQELLDIVSLYTAFLKTIVVHYAHNGTNSPVDIRQLSQPVSLAWGKRRISLADIRRCVGVMDVESSSVKSPFYLVDYGNKKICVELRDEHHGKPLDEQSLVSVFETNLRTIWTELRDAAEADMNAFVLGLPKCPVTNCEALTKASSVLAKGQRNMQELKAGIAARKEEKEAAKMPAIAQSTEGEGTPAATQLSLIDRLRLKEAHLAQLAATGPTSAELERRAALQRADDVAAVIGMLAKASGSTGMGGRLSFKMVTLLQKLKDSLRLPISKEEGAACIRLLAGEVAPEWLKIVVIAGKENVVVQMGRAPSSGTVVERVKTLSS
ncbi:hypothetical protein J7T55_009359 [Diaporthe amygdali]|uniref:uncharacterized protein n=1 Tax=Phomopsis amygdali TaxID=1214568 RepID=UPI0022FF4562|nr:uncharacterized protein J7T55_009359 [Diaporthe amygdali]KAJ0107395.1 hypothetical protein J7T55_009359 [Diaporthe amygdali]